MEPTAWYDLFANKPLVDALLDRLQHRCITIRIDGPSLRTPAPHSPPIKRASKSAHLPSAAST
ncbi:ATP-binding protein [Denitromonas ohlonensis]|uniref:ATP-binding protein n=1 Tax=Denitromonas ohlonensis TaxID=3078508 RepID=UPI001642F9D0|nr:ATP-binding protein [Denitromonas ohlonensis]